MIVGEFTMTEIDPKRRRVWFITGTSSGMGYATTKAALEHGDLVTATARNTGAIEELAADFPGRELAIKLDVRDEEATRMAVSETVGGEHSDPLTTWRCWC